MTTQFIPWESSDDGGPLGRHVNHDEKNRDYPIRALIGPVAARVAVLHKRHGHVFDQGRYYYKGRWIGLGSCTGNAGAGALMIEPLYRRNHNYTERTAVSLYSRATQLDPFDGTWPDDDTGSDGTSVCKAMQERKLITEYRWAFGIEQALDALQYGPVMTGVWWPEGFDRPDANGRVNLAGRFRGGHEFTVRGYDPDANEVLADNSWSLDWGKQGSFIMKVRDWASLLEQQGDVSIPVRSA